MTRNCIGIFGILFFEFDANDFSDQSSQSPPQSCHLGPVKTAVMMRDVSPPRCLISVWPAMVLLCLHLASTSGLQTIDFRRQGELFFSSGVRVNYEECEHSFYDEVYEYEDYYQGIENLNCNIHCCIMKESRGAGFPQVSM